MQSKLKYSIINKKLCKSNWRSKTYSKTKLKTNIKHTIHPLQPLDGCLWCQSRPPSFRCYHQCKHHELDLQLHHHRHCRRTFVIAYHYLSFSYARFVLAITFSISIFAISGVSNDLFQSVTFITVTFGTLIIAYVARTRIQWHGNKGTKGNNKSQKTRIVEHDN